LFGFALEENLDEVEDFAEFSAIKYDIWVFRCAKGAEFDRTPTVSTCVYKCPREGFLEYSLNDKMYYECRSSNSTGILRNCEDDTTFDPNAGLCFWK
jgi:hypothetical protein